MVHEGQRIGSYRVVRKLGEGGMGAVYEAVHDNIERRVAIKILHPRFSGAGQGVTRFLNEARAVNIVDHPGVVSASDFGELPDGTAFIVMELLRGESLRLRMQHPDGTDLSEALRMTRQIAGALAAAHDKGIIHRDLKPDNVMLVPDPEAPGGERVKVLDFGIAKVAEPMPGPGEQVRTETGMILGTPTYMAPEQCRGAGGVTDRADVYSLGVILYQLLAGRPPFLAQGSGEVLAMHMYREPPQLGDLRPGLDPELVTLVHTMLGKEPEARPSMGQVVTALGHLGGGVPTVPPARAARRDPTPDALAMTFQPASLEIAAGPEASSGGSTLSKASGQARTMARPQQRGPWALLGLGLVLAMGVIAWHRTHRETPAASPVMHDQPQVGLRALHDLHESSGAARALLKDADVWEAAAADFARAATQRGAPLRWRSGRAFCAGRARLLRGDAKGSAQDFREAMQLEPGWAEAHIGLSDALAHAGDRAGALAEAHRAQELEPASWQPLAALAAIYANDNQLDQAIQTYRRALAISHEEPSVLDALALALHAARLDSEAEAVSAQALSRDAGLLWSRVLHAERALERDDGETALAEATRAVSVAPNTAAAQLARADALALLHRQEEALSAYQHFLELLSITGSLGLPADRVALVRGSIAAGDLPSSRTATASTGAHAHGTAERSSTPPLRTRMPTLAPARTRATDGVWPLAF